jgi:hypothetical protein
MFWLMSLTGVELVEIESQCQFIFRRLFHFSSNSLFLRDFCFLSHHSFAL